MTPDEAEARIRKLTAHLTPEERDRLRMLLTRVVGIREVANPKPIPPEHKLRAIFWGRMEDVFDWLHLTRVADYCACKWAKHSQGDDNFVMLRK